MLTGMVYIKDFMRKRFISLKLNLKDNGGILTCLHLLI